jgi:hypothetical protein
MVEHARPGKDKGGEPMSNAWKPMAVVVPLALLAACADDAKAPAEERGEQAVQRPCLLVGVRVCEESAHHLLEGGRLIRFECMCESVRENS